MKSVLIVEDDDSLRLLYATELKEDGYNVRAVSSGEEAIEAFRETEPDLVLLDIKMGGMSGIEVLGELLKVNKNTRVVINSAYPNFKKEFSTWGAEAYLVKTSDTTVLRQTVGKALRIKPAEATAC